MRAIGVHRAVFYSQCCPAHKPVEYPMVLAVLEGTVWVQEPRSPPACRSRAEVRPARPYASLLSVKQHQMVSVTPKTRDPGRVPGLCLRRPVGSVSQPGPGGEPRGHTGCHSAVSVGARSTGRERAAR